MPVGRPRREAAQEGREEVVAPARAARRVATHPAPRHAGSDGYRGPHRRRPRSCSTSCSRSCRAWSTAPAARPSSPARSSALLPCVGSRSSAVDTTSTAAGCPRARARRRAQRPRRRRRRAAPTAVEPDTAVDTGRCHRRAGAAASPTDGAAPAESELPIQDYDSLAASQVVPRLATLEPRRAASGPRLRGGDPAPPDDPATASPSCCRADVSAADQPHRPVARWCVPAPADDLDELVRLDRLARDHLRPAAWRRDVPAAHRSAGPAGREPAATTWPTSTASCCSGASVRCRSATRSPRSTRSPTAPVPRTSPRSSSSRRPGGSASAACCMHQLRALGERPGLHRDRRTGAAR